MGPRRRNVACILIYHQQIAFEYVGGHVIAAAAELLLLFQLVFFFLQHLDLNLTVIMALDHGGKMPWGYRWRSSRWLIFSTMTVALFAGKILI